MWVLKDRYRYFVADADAMKIMCLNNRYMYKIKNFVNPRLDV